jgi:polar amino acid transport system permease protein
MWDWGAFLHYLHNGYLLKGAGVTLALSLACLAIGLVCGTLAALMRMSPRAYLNKPAAFYIWLMRGTPVLVQLIIIYTGLPQLGIRFNVIESCLLGLGLNEGAYLAEIIRAGILSVAKGQFDAARSVGMTHAMTMRIIVLPQAMRVIIPPLGNTFNSLLKTTSLASVISMEELLRRTEVLIQVQFKVLEIFIVAALYYLVMTTIWGFIQERLEAHFSRSHAPVKARGAAAVPNGARAEIEKVLLSHDAQ